MNLVEDCKFLTEGWYIREGHIVPQTTTCFILKSIIEITKCKNILEIGFNFGHSAYTFMTIDPNIEYHSVDICQHKYTKPNFEKLSEIFGDRFTFAEKNSRHLRPEDVEKYDMVFVDGDHSTHGMSSDLNLCNEAKIKYILVDDYVRCLSEEENIYPKQLIDHFLSKDTFPYCKIKEYIYEATDRTNHMVLLERD
mgnify:FL=1